MTATATATYYRATEEIAALVCAFEAGTLPRDEWTHAAHLTVALWYLLRHDAEEATNLTRAGILRYNAAHGIATTPTGGYHETLTLFWMRAVRAYLDQFASDNASLVALANGLITSCDKGLPFRHYTRERLFSPAARAVWVEPDILSTL